MTRYTDNLWGDLVREHGATLAHADRPSRAGPLSSGVRASWPAARSRWLVSVRRSRSA